MKILLSNDDGYRAEGLRALSDALAPLAEITVVAPDRNRSGASNSLTLDVPLRVLPYDERKFLVVNGTPTDCVHLAISGLFEGESDPDMVISGINDGANLGDDVLYSGTVAAAMEATILGIPAVALSYVGRDFEAIEEWEPLLRGLLERLMTRADFPPETLLNVNLPPVRPEQVEGIRVTSLGRRAYVGSLTRATDPNGREYFWIGGGESKWWGGPHSDFHAIHDRYISVTPLHLDLTNYRLMESLGAWDLKL